MGVPRQMHPVDKIKGHRSASQKRIRTRGFRVGPPSLPSICTSMWSSPYSSLSLGDKVSFYRDTWSSLYYTSTTI